MLTRPQIYLASIFIKIFYRDRQSLFLSLLFPLIFTGIFLFSGGEPSPTKLGLVNHSQDELSIKFVELVKKAVMGALTLYLDFINLFIMLLRLFGQRR